MDSTSFDRLVTAADHRTSRRSTLRLLAGGLVGGFIALRGTVAARAGDTGVSSDSDFDGLLDRDESAVYGTNPFNVDSDFDGSGDGEEVFYGTDPLVANGGSAAGQVDSDGDGLFDADETGVYGTYPGAYDSDGDGVGDGQEVYNDTNPAVNNGGGGYEPPVDDGGYELPPLPVDDGGFGLPPAPIDAGPPQPVNQSSAASS